MLNNIYTYLIPLRNFYKNQIKQVVIIEKNNQIIKNKWYIWVMQILVFFNLTNIINDVGYNYLYNMDDIYFYYNLKSSNKLKFYSNIIIEFNHNKNNITDIIKKYHINVPIYIIFNLENLEKKDNYIEIKFINLGKISTKIYNNFNEIKFKKLNELI
jgi:hypothetical protein